ncbi:hypothetical protein I352_02618 [Cryptococcus deuterogattii MMRL2647]|nr:hypothetical protein I352_02618 [Cryptococcus deuterogattii MMRL2647]
MILVSEPVFATSALLLTLYSFSVSPMPPAEPPLPPAASTLSLPDSSLAAAAAANVTFATPLREGAILCRISQLEVGSPPNNLPASPAASLPSNSSAVAPQ